MVQQQRNVHLSQEFTIQSPPRPLPSSNALTAKLTQSWHVHPVQEFTIQSPSPTVFQSSYCEGYTIMPWPPRTGIHNTKSFPHPLSILLLRSFIQSCHGDPIQEFTIKNPPPTLFQSSCCEAYTIMPCPPRTGIHNTKSLPHPLSILLLRGLYNHAMATPHRNSQYKILPPSSFNPLAA
jgi:hypothetical protein